MLYRSTRGEEGIHAQEVLQRGLARDGGLYLPETMPHLDLRNYNRHGLPSYPGLANDVLSQFTGSMLKAEALEAILTESYAQFDHACVAPLCQIGPNAWLMELFHGPSLAFKDYALQVLGRLFNHMLARSGDRAVILGATSGDTGSAAIAACAGLQNVEVVILFPQDGPSNLQKRQMTVPAFEAENVHPLAVDGSFDDCQALVKKAFTDPDLGSLALTAVNSINWFRIAAQTVYYVQAALALGAPHRRIQFAVPSGNFGNAYAAHVARRMGVPIDPVIIGTNHNDALTRFFTEGTLQAQKPRPSLSPSMDIQIPSNLERYMFEILDGDAEKCADWMQRLRDRGHIKIGKGDLKEAQSHFQAFGVSDDETLETIRNVYHATGQIIDPHTAVGVAAAQKALDGDPSSRHDSPMVITSCAHPAKFPETTARALGHSCGPVTHPGLAELENRKEFMNKMQNDYATLKNYLLNEL